MLTAMLACEAAPQFRWTPLLLACEHGHLEVVEALLAKGADVEEKTNVIIVRLRPLSIALTHTHAACALLPLGGGTCMYTSLAVSRDGASAKA